MICWVFNYVNNPKVDSPVWLVSINNFLTEFPENALYRCIILLFVKAANELLASACSQDRNMSTTKTNSSHKLDITNKDMIVLRLTDNDYCSLI